MLDLEYVYYVAEYPHVERAIRGEGISKWNIRPNIFQAGMLIYLTPSGGRWCGPQARRQGRHLLPRGFRPQTINIGCLTCENGRRQGGRRCIPGSLGAVTDSTTDQASDEPADFSFEATRVTLEAACQQAGFNSTGAKLMRIGENALYRLSDRPVVARIARTMDYWDQARKEVSVSIWLADVAYPAARIADLASQPIEANGHPVTFWRFIAGGDAMPEHVTTLARLLRRFHSLSIPARASLPDFNFADRLTRRLETAPVSASDKSYLLAKFEELSHEAERLKYPLEQCPVHGDAHIKNVMFSEGNPVLIDFENVGYGHPEWDVAVTATEHVTAQWWSVDQYASFVEAYGFDITEWAGFDVLRQIQEIKMTTWLMQNVNQSRDIADEFDARMRTIRTGRSEVPWQPY